jgi:hypothetical protein
MGKGFDVSPFQAAVQAVDGVMKVNIFSPQDDVLPTSNPTETEANKIGYAQLVTLGQRTVRYYFEKPSGR